ncbi:MAG: hypothetical protein FJW38_09400 [Acidobacteria bacterium]|nr:hypothetical protein [Acidobacteriota bacterium]
MILESNNGQVLYATNGRALLKSSDSGANWLPLSFGEPGTPAPPFGAIMADARSPSTLYYATSASSSGVWKSTDAGATWARANSGLPATGTVAASYFTIASNGALYVRFGTEMYKSANDGAAWTRITAPLPGPAGHFDVNFSNPLQMLYVSGAAVWRSTDEGVSWRLTGTLRTFGESATGASCLASDPNNPNLVYVCVAGSLLRVGNSTVTGLHRSFDGGLSFTPPPDFPIPAMQPVRIWVARDGSQNLYLGSSAGGYCRSPDQGRTFTCPSPSAFGNDINPTSESLNHMDRQNSNLLFASAGSASLGSLHFHSRDAGGTWQRLEVRAKGTLGSTTTALASLLAPNSSEPVALPVSVVEFMAARVPFTATSSGESWFSLSANAGTTPSTITVTFRSAGLEQGRRYEGTIRLSSTETINASATIPVVLEIARRVPGPAPRYQVSTIAGTGASAFSGDGGPAAAAGIGDTSAIAIGQDQTIYFIGTTHNRIRRITASGNIETIAGTGTSASAADGAHAVESPLLNPRGLAVDTTGNIFVGDSNGVIRRIANGLLSTAIPRSTLLLPSALAVDARDRLWVIDLGARIYRYAPPAGVVRLTTTPSLEPATLSGLAIDASDNIYVSASTAGRVYKVTPAGVVSVYAGNGSAGSDAEGVPALTTGLESPTALAVDSKGNLFVLESRRNRIRVVTPSGIVDVAAAPEGMVLRQLAAGRDGNVYATASGFILRLSPAPPPVPLLTSRPRNPASGAEAVSSGSVFFIEGERLSDGQESTAAPPLRLSLAGTSATIGGIPVPLSLASPNRLAGQIPWEVEPGEGREFTISVNGIAGGSMRFDLLSAAPGIFTMPEDPARAAGAVVENGEASVLVTGFGAVDPALVSGAAVPEDPVSKAVLPFEVTVGDAAATPIEITVVPGLPGIGRARFQLPAGLGAGDYAVTIRIGEATSNMAAISVP